jgi:tetratricopeptide (TPR) repeat protein
MLYLHMAALACVEQLPVSADALLDDIVSHEEHFWLRQFEETYSTKLLDRIKFAAGARRAVAAVTLLGGVPTIEAAEELNARVDGPREEHLCPFLRWLYPGRGEIGAQDVYLSGLEPGLLGEALVARVLSDRNTRQDYLEKVFAGAVETALRTGFVVLTRMALRRGKEAETWMKQVLDADVLVRAKPAFEAVLTLGTETACVPLGLALAEALEREGTTELAMTIELVIPEQTVSLREVAVWATQTLLRQSRTDTKIEDVLKERARLLNNLGPRLSALGRGEEALEATREAVEHYRTLAEARPDAFFPDLAMSLNNLGTMLRALGRREEALEATREAVDIRRTLADTRPDAFLPDLAMSLNNLGTMFRDLGRREEALEATRKAVDVRRTLADTRPDAFLPDLAMSLNNLGATLRDLGHREEALEATREAVEHYRTLADTRPDAFLPDLAMSLNNLGTMFRDLDRREEALEPTREAVRLYGTLVEHLPQAQLQNFIVSLRNLAERLQEFERSPEKDPTIRWAHEILEKVGIDRDPE